MSVDLCRKSIYHRLLEKDFAFPDRNRIRDKSGLKIPRPERAVLVRVQQRAPSDRESHIIPYIGAFSLPVVTNIRYEWEHEDGKAERDVPAQCDVARAQGRAAPVGRD